MMKRFVPLIIGCSLTLAVAAMAQQPDDQQQQKTKKEKKGQQEQQQNAPQNQQNAGGGRKEQGKGAGQGQMQAQERAPGHNRDKGQGKKAEGANATPAASTDTSAQQNGGMNAGTQKGKHGNKKERAAAQNAQPGTSASPAGATADTSAAPATTGNKKADRRAAKAEKMKAQASPNAAATNPGASPAAQTNTAVNTKNGGAVANGTVGKNGKKADIQAIKTQNASFKAQPKPEKVPTVSFNQNYRINGADQWQGERYVVFRNYRPEMHDSGWYRSRYNRVELMGGGYYYFNNGYWYPAWGYNPQSAYYAYDGPIYVGSAGRPMDQVVADVQSALQQMGYYQGEVDGLLGPLTRQALTEYQSDHQLYATAAIDEPTLDALGLG